MSALEPQNAELHLPRELLDARVRALPAPPAAVGAVRLVVVRPQPGERLTPARCLLSPERGLEGDRWLHAEKRLPEAQLTVMRADVAELIANGQPLALFGDNLLVDLDLSRDNLPPGTRVRAGAALCEVTPKPHNGCTKFAARFGQASRDLVGAEEFREHRLRGLYLRVLEPGEVGPEDRIEILERAAVATLP